MDLLDDDVSDQSEEVGVADLNEDDLLGGSEDEEEVKVTFDRLALYLRMQSICDVKIYANLRHFKFRMDNRMLNLLMVYLLFLKKMF